MIAPRIFSPSHLIFLVGGGGVMVGTLLAVWSWLVPFLTPALGLGAPLALGLSPTGGLAWWVVLPLVVAIGGWAFAFFQETSPHHGEGKVSHRMKSLYVLFLNKGYFDEIYEAYLVQPTLRMAYWLWQKIDVQGIDRFVHGTASVSVGLAQWMWQVVDLKGIDRLTVGLGYQSVGLARWMWQVVDLKGIDRLTVGLGQQSVGFGRWLWQLIDIRGIEGMVDRVGKGTDATGHYLDSAGPRTLQHHLLVMIFWLVLAIGVLYLLTT